MRIAIVQLKAVKGDIERNLENHTKFIEKAAAKQADMVVFPELSLTGYEPELVRQLATTKDDERLGMLQLLSNRHAIIIGAGLPTVKDGDIFVSMVIFSPGKNRVVYSKQYLYPTETEVFTPGGTPLVIPFDAENIVAPAICYELSNTLHHEYACRNRATAYVASVLNSVNGVDSDIEKLSAIALQYKMTVFMANYIGESGGYKCAGKSSVWNDKGELLAQLDGETEGLLLYDTKSGEVIAVK